MAELDAVAFSEKMHAFILEVLPYLAPIQRLDVREQGLEVLLSQNQVLVGISDEDLLLVAKAASLCVCDSEALAANALTLLVNISADSLRIFEDLDTAELLLHCFTAGLSIRIFSFDV